MSEGVVDVFEVVDIEEDDADRVPGAFGAGEGLTYSIDEQGAIREVGQRVVEREILESSVVLAPLKHVANRALQQVGGESVLDEVVRRAGEHCQFVNLGGVFASEQNPRCCTERLARGLKQFDAGLFAKSVVDEAHVVVARLECGETTFRVRFPRYVVALRRHRVQEIAGEEVVILIVLDQKYGYAGHGPQVRSVLVVKLSPYRFATRCL